MRSRKRKPRKKLRFKFNEAPNRDLYLEMEDKIRDHGAEHENQTNELMEISYHLENLRKGDDIELYAEREGSIEEQLEDQRVAKEKIRDNLEKAKLAVDEFLREFKLTPAGRNMSDKEILSGFYKNTNKYRSFVNLLEQTLWFKGFPLGEYLIKKGADVNAPVGRWSYTPLMHVTEDNDYENVKNLLASGAKARTMGKHKGIELRNLLNEIEVSYGEEEKLRLPVDVTDKFSDEERELYAGIYGLPELRRSDPKDPDFIDFLRQRRIADRIKSLRLIAKSGAFVPKDSLDEFRILARMFTYLIKEEERLTKMGLAPRPDYPDALQLYKKQLKFAKKILRILNLSMTEAFERFSRAKTRSEIFQSLKEIESVLEFQVNLNLPISAQQFTEEARIKRERQEPSSYRAAVKREPESVWNREIRQVFGNVLQLMKK